MLEFVWMIVVILGRCVGLLCEWVFGVLGQLRGFWGLFGVTVGWGTGVFIVWADGLLSLVLGSSGVWEVVWWGLVSCSVGLGDYWVGLGDCGMGFGLNGFTKNMVGIIVGYD